MNAKERRQRLAEEAARRGEVSFDEAAELFQVSPMTIRRDVEALERDGLARRIPGGLIPTAPQDQPFASRVLSQAHEKEDIARLTVGQLHRGECVLIDSGSTALAVAKAIKGSSLGLTVITPSLPAAMELAGEPDTSVLLPGGTLRPGELCLLGPETTAALDRYNIDVFIMGVGGVDADRGISDFDPDEAVKKRAGIRAAQRTIVCVDASKLGQCYAPRVAGLEQIDVIVTDGPPSHPAVTAAQAVGVEVLVASTGSSRAAL